MGKATQTLRCREEANKESDANALHKRLIVGFVISGDQLACSVAVHSLTTAEILRYAEIGCSFIINPCRRSLMANSSVSSRSANRPEKKIGPFPGGVGVAIWLNA